jgi:hypothetical protein
MVTSISLINILNNKGEFGGLGSTFIFIRAYYVDTTPRFLRIILIISGNKKTPPYGGGDVFPPQSRGRETTPTI